MLVYMILMAVFLALSAFFSGMEAAIFSMSRFRIKTLMFEEKRGARILDQIKKEPGKTLAAVLLANLLVNIGAAAVGAVLLLQVIQIYALNATVSFFLEFILMTSLLLIIGEITPKTIAISNAEILSLRFGGMIAFIGKIFSPVSSVMESMTRRILKGQVIKEHTLVSDKEIQLMLREAKENNVLDPGEERFGYQILQFSKVRASEIMTPRQKVVGLSVSASLEKARKSIKTKKHSRICVYDEKENVIGILYAKDVILQSMNDNRDSRTSIRELMREPYIIHEGKKAENLLAEFRKQGIHIAVVVDEYGDFTGIVTLEDILESLYGEIIDEYDERGELTDIPYIKVSQDTYLFEGDIRIGELARIMEIVPFAEENERLSGFIMDHFKRVPREEESIKVSGLEITVDEVRDRLIEKVIVKKVV